MDAGRLARLRQEAEWRRCKRDPAYWFANYCYISAPGRGKILFTLRPAQLETLQAMQDERYVIILKARQIGYSTLMACFALWEALFNTDQHIIFLSIGEREAASVLQKTKYAYKFLPDWMRDRAPSVTTDNMQRLDFDNDSTIRSLPSKKDPARGESVTRVFVDEWASFESPEEAWSSIEPITDVGGKIVGLSTAKGWGNFFHEMWVRARTGTSEFLPLFFPYTANTDRDDNWYTEKALANPAWFMAQEYPRTEDEAFLKSGNPVMDLELLSSLPTNVAVDGELSGPEGQQHPGGWKFQRHVGGRMHLWEHPDKMDAYVIGADVAEGKIHGDYSSAHVISMRTGLVAAEWHGHIEADLYGEHLYALGMMYNTALLGVEVNNHGLSTLHALRRLEYPRLYYRHNLSDRTGRQTNEMGWRTMINTKALMIDELAAAVRNGHAYGGIQIWGEHTIAELKTFVRDPDGKTHGSPHDDRVISLAIANQMRKYSSAPEFSIEYDDYMTGDWWARQITEAEPGRGSTAIGAHNVRRAS